MQHEVHLGSAHLAEGSQGGVSRFAAEVVARLVAKDAADGSGLREELLSRFMLAVSSMDAAAFEELKPELRRARVSAAMLADLYIPEVARRLGEAWETDCVSFAQVTMGVARLQAILREIGSGWSADTAAIGEATTLLLILPQGEQHTLGAMVLAGRLRRMGISVSVKIAPSIAELAEYVAERSFDGALISIACEDRLEICRKLVKTLKEASDGRLKVAIGGALAEADENVMRLTGADVVTNDIALALERVGVASGVLPELETS